MKLITNIFDQKWEKNLGKNVFSLKQNREDEKKNINFKIN